MGEGSANAVSDLERAEHNETYGIKKVGTYEDAGNGNLDLKEKDHRAPYSIADIDDAGYYGFLKADGGWYIMRLIANEARYAKGSSNYTTAWTGRAGLSYDHFNNIF